MKKLLIPAILLAILGCKGQQGPAGEQGADGGGNYIYGEVDNTGEVFVGVYFSPVIPWVTVNQETLDVDYCDGLFTQYEDSISISSGDSLYLKVDCTDGIATAEARVPGDFEITSHDTSQIVYIPKDSDFTVSWSSADCDFYRVYFWLDCGYYDTLGNHKYFYLDIDTCVTSTSVTFPASRLFPAYVDSITSGNGNFGVYAMNGPKLEPGSKGNVTGNGSGFFWGSAHGGDLNIRVEGSKCKAGKERAREELRKRWFDKAKAIDPEYQRLKEEFQREE